MAVAERDQREGDYDVVGVHHPAVLPGHVVAQGEEATLQEDEDLQEHCSLYYDHLSEEEGCKQKEELENEQKKCSTEQEIQRDKEDERETIEFERGRHDKLSRLNFECLDRQKVMQKSDG